MKPRDHALAQRLDAGLLAFEKKKPLLGIQSLAARQTFLEQVLESVHRVRYISVIRTRDISARRANPHDEMFDSLKAALLHQRQGNIDEAFWLVFLSVHFGRHALAGWRYTREIYGCLGAAGRWDWASTSADPAKFRTWLHAHQNELKRVGTPRGFGNHRKYQSLDAYSPNGTGAAVESYVNWVKPPRTHDALMQIACSSANNQPRQAFHILYRSMSDVASFGRTARFDYLAMIGKLGLASIEPGSAYIQSSTGPVSGARLLFGGRKTAPLRVCDLDQWLVEMDDHLHVGMQVLEDTLCNWQKSPDCFQAFRG